MGYADDVSLLDEDAKEVQKLLSACEKFGDDWAINYIRVNLELIHTCNHLCMKLFVCLKCYMVLSS
jgi:hypothetical protein